MKNTLSVFCFLFLFCLFVCFAGGGCLQLSTADVEPYYHSMKDFNPQLPPMLEEVSYTQGEL